MGFLDAFKKSPETVGDLQKKQQALQEQFETDQKASQKARSRCADSKAKLVAYNNQFGQVLRLVDGKDN